MSTIPSEDAASIVKSLQNNTIVKSVDISIPFIPHDWNDTGIIAIENNEHLPRHNSGGPYEDLYDMKRVNSTIKSLTIHQNSQIQS